MEKIRSLFRKSSSQSFQILSDLHLEVGQQYSSFEIPPSAPYLVLAGDIGLLTNYDAYLAFLVRQTQRFKKVFLVIGNHELYGLTFTTGLEQARKLELEPILKGRMVLLHQKRFDVPNSSISILGCTLWSKIPDDAQQVVQMKVADFWKITDWSAASHNAAYETDLSWLKNQVAELQKASESSPKKKSPERTTVIITHHAPSTQKTADPMHDNSPLTSAFATDLLNGEDWPNVKLWVFGHTHFTTEFKKDGIKVVSNQRGYVFPNGDRVQEKNNEKKKKKGVFDVRKVVHV
jgi:predicted phosphodiesterase